jgi:spore maturation protein CgeB
MQILVIGNFYQEAFGLHIAETLDAMGHVTRRFEPGVKSNRVGGRIGHRWDQVRGVVHAASDALPRVREHRMKALWRVAASGPLDLVILCHDFLWPREVTKLKCDTGAKVAMWFPDALVNFGKGYFMNAPYDGLFFKDPYVVKMMTAVVQSPVHYLPECCNPRRHRLPEGEEPGEEYRCEITTAGNPHSWRMATYTQLDEYDVKLWAAPVPLWMPGGPAARMHQGRPVRNEEKAKAFLGAKIVLNNLYIAEVWGLNARAFEATGIGAFQLLSWRPGLQQLFEDGKELVSFSGMEDLKQKIDYFLTHEDERSEIAQAGKVRALRDHTYTHRLELLLETVAGRAEGYDLPEIRY